MIQPSPAMPSPEPAARRFQLVPPFPATARLVMTSTSN